MIGRRTILFAILICLGCGPRKPTVIDPAHPELRHWRMFVDYSYQWPTTQPATKPEGD